MLCSSISQVLPVLLGLGSVGDRAEPPRLLPPASAVGVALWTKSSTPALHGKQRFRHSGSGSGVVQPGWRQGASNDVAVLDGDHDGIACFIRRRTHRLNRRHALLEQERDRLNRRNLKLPSVAEVCGFCGFYGFHRIDGGLHLRIGSECAALTAARLDSNWN